jgi:hypothetical protein
MFFKIIEAAKIFKLPFSTVKVRHQFRQKMCWATFWAAFSHIHLVALVIVEQFNSKMAKLFWRIGPI